MAAGGFRMRLELVEQHGFADAAQPKQYDVLRRPSGAGPVDCGSPAFQHAVPASKLRRRRAGARIEWISRCVHLWPFRRSLSFEQIGPHSKWTRRNWG